MSTDRRPLEECEILYIFEHYLRKWCEDHEGEDTIFIKDKDGKLIFKATLLDKEEERTRIERIERIRNYDRRSKNQ